MIIIFSRFLNSRVCPPRESLIFILPDLQYLNRGRIPYLSSLLIINPITPTARIEPRTIRVNILIMAVGIQMKKAN